MSACKIVENASFYPMVRRFEFNDKKLVNVHVYPMVRSFLKMIDFTRKYNNRSNSYLRTLRERFFNVMRKYVTCENIRNHFGRYEMTLSRISEILTLRG